MLLGKSCLVHMILKWTILKKKKLNDKYILKKKQFVKVLDGTEVLYVGRWGVTGCTCTTEPENPCGDDDEDIKVLRIERWGVTCCPCKEPWWDESRGFWWNYQTKL